MRVCVFIVSMYTLPASCNVGQYQLQGVLSVGAMWYITWDMGASSSGATLLSVGESSISGMWLETLP